MPSPQYDNLVQTFKAQRPELLTRSIQEMRENFELLARMAPPLEGAEVTTLDVNGIRADRVTTPDSDTTRTVLYFHGGGYCIGSPMSHQHVAARLAKQAGAPVVLADYRLAPEHPFPAANEDAKTSYTWLLDKGFDPSQIAVAGDSAGGGLALGLLVSLRDEGIPVPAGAALLSPWCDVSGLGEVSDQALDMDYLRPETLAEFADAFTPECDRADARCSPLNAELHGLPPVLIQVGEHEILYDMGRRLAERANEAGVDVTLDVEPEMFHAWHLFAGILPEADAAIERVGAFLREQLA